MPVTVKQRLLDLLAIGRVANLPTVWSNVILGNLLAFAIAPHVPHATHFWGLGAMSENFSLLLVSLATCTCAYLFGTFLNDWQDASFDYEHRPERAIPSGRLREKTVFNIAIVFLLLSLAGFAVLTRRGPAIFVTGLLLLGCIVTYTAIHKRTPLAIIPMGLCRSLLYLIGFLAIDVRWEKFSGVFTSPASLVTWIYLLPVLILILAAIGILSYVAGLTLAARYESRPEGFKAPRAFFWFLLFLPFLTHSWWWIMRSPPFLAGWHLAIPALLGLVPFLLWTTRALFVLKKSIPDFVSRALAGLCLVDLLAFPGIAANIRTFWPPVDSFPLVLALIPLSLFILALLLQRIAPAT